MHCINTVSVRVLTVLIIKLILIKILEKTKSDLALKHLPHSSNVIQYEFLRRFFKLPKLSVRPPAKRKGIGVQLSFTRFPGPIKRILFLPSARNVQEN